MVDAKVHTLNPTDNGIRQAKLTEVHPSNISWHPLLAEIFNSPITAGTYHGQRVAVSVLCGANQFGPQIGPWGRYATLCKTVYQQNLPCLRHPRPVDILHVSGRHGYARTCLAWSCFSNRARDAIMIAIFVFGMRKLIACTKNQLSSRVVPGVVGQCIRRYLWGG